MNHPDSLQRIVGLLGEAALDDGRWREASALIDAACGTKGGMLTFGDEPTKGNIHLFFAKCFYRGVDRSASARDYLENYHREDEHLPRLRMLPDGKIVALSDLYSERELKTSRAFNECYARNVAQNGLRVRLDGPGGSRIVWGIADSISGHGWSPSQVDMVRRILPHLRQYVRVRTALADAGALGSSVTELLENARVCVIQLDRDGRIVEANNCAAELLRRNDGLFDRDGLLHAARAEDNSRLQALLARALPRLVGYGASGSMTVRRPSQLPGLAMHVKPVTTREVDYRARRVAALVLVVDPMNRTRVDPHLVQSMLGLTPTESQIASMLAAGRTLRQIAQITHREYGTVRTHLKSIFLKLGVSRQLEVAQLVLALANLPVARD